MSSFNKITDETPLAEVIKSAFGTSLSVSGGWGYAEENATRIEKNSSDTPLSQLEHMLASMRTYLEMHMTREESERYGNINLNETGRKAIKRSGKYYDKVHYEITAMKETLYADFINEYKESYGKNSFNIETHFKRRKEATLIRKIVFWFETTHVVK